MIAVLLVTSLSVAMATGGLLVGYLWFLGRSIQSEIEAPASPSSTSWDQLSEGGRR